MKKVILLILFFIISIFLYILTIKGVYGNPGPEDVKTSLNQATKPFELSPERGRYAQIISLVLYHRYDLNKTLSDAVYPDVGYYNGRLYAYFAPGISILAAPLYIIGAKFNLSQVATFSLSLFFAVSTGFMIYIVSRKIFELPTWASLLGALIYMFGSTSWSYAVTLYEHQATSFLIISSLFAVWYFKNKKPLFFIAAIYVGLAYSLAILIDYPNALFMAPIMIYFIGSAFRIFRIKGKIRIEFRLLMLLSAIPFVLITCFHFYYNSVNFGSWYHLTGALPSYKTILEKSLTTIQANSRAIKNPLSFFSQDKFVFGIYTLLISPDRGLFLYSPIFILSIFGLIRLIKKMDIEISVLLAVLGCVLFLYSSWGDPWGGWAFGPRYLIPVLPTLSIFAAYMVFCSKKIWMKLVVFILFMYSSAIALLGVLTTNAIPPKIEADYLHTGYNFLLNLQYLLEGRSSSFIYNNFLSSQISLVQYYGIIYSIIILFAILVVFVLPKLEKYGN